MSAQAGAILIAIVAIIIGAWAWCAVTLAARCDHRDDPVEHPTPPPARHTPPPELAPYHIAAVREDYDSD